MNATLVSQDDLAGCRLEVSAIICFTTSFYCSFFPFDVLQSDYFAWNGTLEETLERIRNEDSLIIEPRTTCYYR